MFSRIQSTKSTTLMLKLYPWEMHNGVPKLVIPCNMAFPSMLGQTIGPPESPLHVDSVVQSKPLSETGSWYQSFKPVLQILSGKKCFLTHLSSCGPESEIIVLVMHLAHVYTPHAKMPFAPKKNARCGDLPFLKGYYERYPKRVKRKYSIEGFLFQALFCSLAIKQKQDFYYINKKIF